MPEDDVQSTASSDRPGRYREPLPAQCPPEDAKEIVSELNAFRLVSCVPPCDDDFRSQRAEKPNARFNVDECTARGVSLFLKLEDALNARRLPKLKTKVPCQVRLHAGAGRIKQFGRIDSHQTWWPYAEYDILVRCEVVS